MENKLKEARIQKGFSQKQLASIVGITRPALSNIERGEVAPGSIVLLKLCKAVGKKVEEIFFIPSVLHEEHKYDI
ncbi:putative transcriptional regulator [Clostridium beijerinckii]|uniref:helix-turn-helix transcriptional regulator n=1 Tax=Clostridium beijerinckii TaxID=1520 RepID=UPI001494C073|nr:helix-turn-helix transcriptional regulator [Clostridium beijerinckii]NOW92369.1 putative transcriptional regulator [Clostridium beijerinckii]